MIQSERAFQKQAAQAWLELERADSRKVKDQRPLELRETQLFATAAAAEAVNETNHEARLNAVLVIPAWDPITLAYLADGAAHSLSQQLLNVERQARCDFLGIGVWKPAESTLAAVGRKLRAGDRAAVGQLFARKSRAIFRWQKPATRPRIHRTNGQAISATQPANSSRRENSAQPKRCAKLRTIIFE